MTEMPQQPSEWDLEAWVKALTIEVGTAWACKGCGNLVMVTRGGVGVMELTCCGAPMRRVKPGAGEARP